MFVIKHFEQCFTTFGSPNNDSNSEKFFFLIIASLLHINKIFNRHNSTLITMARGISKLDVDENKNFDNFLTNFYYNRTRTRFLLNNYLEYFNPDQNKIGILYKKFDLRKLIESVKTDLSFMSEIHKYETPEINCNIESIKITPRIRVSNPVQQISRTRKTLPNLMILSF